MLLEHSHFCLPSHILCSPHCPTGSLLASRAEACVPPCSQRQVLKAGTRTRTRREMARERSKRRKGGKKEGTGQVKGSGGNKVEREGRWGDSEEREREGEQKADRQLSQDTYFVEPTQQPGRELQSPAGCLVSCSPVGASLERRENPGSCIYPGAWAHMTGSLHRLA